MERKAAQQNKDLSVKLKQGLSTIGTTQVKKSGGGTSNFLYP